MSKHSRTVRPFAAAAESAAAALFAAAPAARGAAYTIQSLGFANGYENDGYGIDSSGRVLIDYVGANGYEHAAIGTNGTLKPIPGLGGRGEQPFGFSMSGRYATGLARTAGTDPTAANPRHAFLYDDLTGKTTDIPTLGGTDARGVDVNDTGTVVGNSNPTGDPVDANGTQILRPFVYRTDPVTGVGKVSELPVPSAGSYSAAVGINNAGLIVGTANADESSEVQAAVWTANASGGGYTVRQLGSLAGPNGFSEAFRVNANGVVVGLSALADGGGHAVSFANGAITDLGGPVGAVSEAFDITDLNQVVGDAVSAEQSAAGTGGEALLFQNGSVYDLNDVTDAPGWRLQTAQYINNAGQIVGAGTDPDGSTTRPATRRRSS